MTFRSVCFPDKTEIMGTASSFHHELQGYTADFIMMPGNESVSAGNESVSAGDGSAPDNTMDDKKAVITGYLEQLKELQISWQTSSASYAEANAKYQEAQSNYQSLQTEVTEWQNKYNTAQQNEATCERTGPYYGRVQTGCLQSAGQK